MSSSEKNHILPVSTIPTSQPPSKQKSVDWPTNEKPDGRRHRLVCLSCCAGILAVIAITVLVLSFTVYKVREPTMRLNSVNFGDLDLSKNMTVIADVSVKNPNVLPFKFNSSKTSLLYRSREVGLAYGPPGNVGARGTLRTNVTVDVITDRLLNDSNFMGDVGNGSLGIQTSTMVGGKVTILGIFKRHVDVMMNCTVSVSIASQTILEQHCTQRMWL